MVITVITGHRWAKLLWLVGCCHLVMVIKGTRARGCYASNVANERETSGPVAEVSSMGSEDALRASAHPGRERRPVGANGALYRAL